MIYFSWLPAWNTPFNPVIHARQDLPIFDLEIVEEEGAAPHFTVLVANPGIGGILANPNRYAVISEQSPSDAQPVELVRGKVIGAPSELTGPVITLEFSCVQPDADQALRSYADTLRTNNASYDPLFISETEENDPSSALNGRPLNFYWNRRSLLISTSSFVTGSRTVDISAYALQGLSMTLTEPPVRHAKLKVSASWQQRASGTCNLLGKVGRAIGNGKSFSSYTYEDVESWWPAAGSSLGDSTGWTITSSKLTPTGDRVTSPIRGGSYRDRDGTDGDLTPPSRITLRSRSWRIDDLVASYRYTQQRDESVEILAEVGIQDVLGDDRVETLPDVELRDVTLEPTLDDWKPNTAYHVGNKVSYNGKTWLCLSSHTSVEYFAVAAILSTPGQQIQYVRQWQVTTGNAPIGDVRRKQYFATERGRRSVEHAVEILRCFLLKRARCLEVRCDVPWPEGRDLTVADSVRIEWNQLPGGECTGKVTSVTLKADDQGNRLCSLTVGVSVGTGNPSDPPVFAPSEYFDSTENYSLGDYDTPVSTTNRVTPTGVTYSWPTLNPKGRVDAFNLGNSGYSIQTLEARNTAGAQFSSAFFAGAAGRDPVAAIKPTTLKIRMIDLSELDNASLSYLVSCKPMQCNKGINLGASA